MLLLPARDTEQPTVSTAEQQTINHVPNATESHNYIDSKQNTTASLQHINRSQQLVEQFHALTNKSKFKSGEKHIVCRHLKHHDTTKPKRLRMSGTTTVQTIMSPIKDTVPRFNPLRRPGAKTLIQYRRTKNQTFKTIKTRILNQLNQPQEKEITMVSSKFPDHEKHKTLEHNHINPMKTITTYIEQSPSCTIPQKSNPIADPTEEQGDLIDHCLQNMFNKPEQFLVDLEAFSNLIT